MIRKTTLLIYFLTTNLLCAQIFYTEDFETDGNGTRYFPEIETIDGQNDFFARVQDSDHTANFIDDYNGESGTFYWAGEDHDDTQVGGSGNPELELLFNNINITGRTNIFCSALFGGNAVALSYEAADYVIVEYRIDNGSWQSGISFHENGNKQLALDTNSDGVGDGFILNINMEPLEFPIIGSGSEIDIRVRAANNSSNEEWAIDLIQLSENSTLNVQNVIDENDIKIYNNNESGVFQIKTPNHIKIETIEVFDVLGKRAKSIYSQDQITEFRLNVSSLKASIYILKIHTNKGVFNKKIIKRN